MRDKALVLECVTNIRTVISAPDENELYEDDMSIVDQIIEGCKSLDALIGICSKIFLEEIINQRLVDTSTVDIEDGDSVFYTQSMRNATRLQEHLKLPAIKQTEQLAPTHAFLLHTLPDEYLVSYLNLLKFSKIVNNTLVQHLMQHPLDLEIQLVNDFIFKFVSKKLQDPKLGLSFKNDIKSIPNVSLILVYPQINTPSHVGVQHAHENMFRLLLPAIATCVEKVSLTFGVGSDAKTLTVMCLKKIRDCVESMARRRPNDNIFLAGWGLSSLLNIQAVQKVRGVTALLNFATPMRSHHDLGFRGSVDDTMCVSYCPSLFVAGTMATNTNIQELLQLKESMICDVHVIPVKDADNNLCVSPLSLNCDRMTQKNVERKVLDQIKEFIQQVISEGGLTAKQRRKFLVPVRLPDLNDINLELLKNRAVGAMNARGKGKRKKKDT
ncbi:hypothetical protein M3Y97_00632000 [Aphelenchoides bicaudatus]|nr:hypothetical protein M3Y97_00632000 [Aphelenchoides bicaudatus]